MNLNNPARPDYVRPEAAKVLPDLDLIADLLAGTRQMWEMSQTRKYIRKWPDEKTPIYNLRRQCETVFEGLARVLSAAVGFLHAKQPRLEWNASEAAMTGHWENLDAAGTAGPVMVKRFTDSAIRDGIGLILVDHPPAPSGVAVPTLEDEQQLGLRPTWALYERRQAISWRAEVVRNRQTLTQLVLEECGHVAWGDYGVVERRRFRVLRLGPVIADGTDETGRPFTREVARLASWELYEEVKDASVVGGIRLRDQGEFRNRSGVQADFLPIAIAYTGRTEAPLCATIPLLGVAWANLAHWQLATNLRFYRDLAAFPQPVVIGDLAATQILAAGGEMQTIPGKLSLGPVVAVHLKGEGAAFDWKGPPTEAFAPLENGVKEKLEQIGQMGMTFLVSDTRQAETAEAKRLDATAENSTLATAAQGIEDAINLALQHHAWYLGIEKDGAPVLTINKDFESTVMEPAVMLAYIQAAKDIGFPVSQVLRAFQQGGRIPADADLDKLELEMLANAAAEEERKRQEAEAFAERQRLGVGAAA